MFRMSRECHSTWDPEKYLKIDRSAFRARDRQTFPSLFHSSRQCSCSPFSYLQCEICEDGFDDEQEVNKHVMIFNPVREDWHHFEMIMSPLSDPATQTWWIFHLHCIKRSVPTGLLAPRISDNIEYLLEVVWFACIPVFISHWFSSRHPEELALLSLVSPTGPEVFVSHTLQGQEILLSAIAAIPTWVIGRGIWTGDGGTDGRVS